MFVRSAAAAALDRKKDLFSTYDQDRREEQRRVQGWLEELKTSSAASLNRKLDAIDDAWPGALPTAEFDRAVGMRIPLGVTWQNREQARNWALETLAGRPALAVDGSQIVPTTDYSPPVGAVQIGWFSTTAARQRMVTRPDATRRTSPLRCWRRMSCSIPAATTAFFPTGA